MVDYYQSSIYIAVIILIGLIIGPIINRGILPRTNRYLAKKGIRAPRIIIRTLQNTRAIQFFSLLASFYVVNYLFVRESKYSKYFDPANSILTSILIASFFYYFYRSITTVNTYYIRQGKLPDTTIFNNIIKLMLILLASLIITNSLGYSVTPLIATLGIGALAIALALQDSLANLFAGISIVASKQINVGDYVRLDDANEGYIFDVSWRYTVIRTLQNNLIVIPNSVFSSKVLTNYSLPQKLMRILIPIRISYGSDLDQAEEVTLKLAREFQQTFEGADRNFEPRFRYFNLGDYGIDFNVILGINQYEVQAPMRSEFLKKLYKLYNENGIGIPFPTNTILLPKNDKDD